MVCDFCDTVMWVWELLFHTQMLHFHLVLKGLGNLSGQGTSKLLL